MATTMQRRHRHPAGPNQRLRRMINDQMRCCRRAEPLAPGRARYSSPNERPPPRLSAGSPRERRAARGCVKSIKYFLRPIPLEHNWRRRRRPGRQMIARPLGQAGARNGYAGRANKQTNARTQIDWLAGHPAGEPIESNPWPFVGQARRSWARAPPGRRSARARWWWPINQGAAKEARARPPGCARLRPAAKPHPPPLTSRPRSSRLRPCLWRTALDVLVVPAPHHESRDPGRGAQGAGPQPELVGGQTNGEYHRGPPPRPWALAPLAPSPSPQPPALLWLTTAPPNSSNTPQLEFGICPDAPAQPKRTENGAKQELHRLYHIVQLIIRLLVHVAWRPPPPLGEPGQAPAPAGGRAVSAWPPPAGGGGRDAIGGQLR